MDALEVTVGDSKIADQHRMLLVKFGAIGDVIMAVPAAAAQHAAGYQIDWVCSEAVAPVLRLYSWIYVIPVNEPKLLRGSLFERITGIVELWSLLRHRIRARGKYDLIATLYYDRRYRLVSLPIRAGRKVTLSRTDRSLMLLPGRHHTDEYDRILSGRAEGEMPRQLSPVKVPYLAAPMIVPHQSKVRIVLAPGGARNALRDDTLRRWPVEHYVLLARDLVQHGFEVVLIGGPEDRWASSYFDRLQRENGIVDLIARTSLSETLAVLESAAVTVTHDTGPLHLAGITSTCIVALFGPTDPNGRLPHRDNAVAIWGGAGFACRPCYDGRDYAPCVHNGCMSQITPAAVMNVVLSLVRAIEEERSVSPRVITPGPQDLVHIQQVPMP